MSDSATIAGASPWKYDDKRNNVYQTEHDELFASIRNGQPINNGDYMCKSTLTAIMGRIAAYTGTTVTWEELVNSDLDLSPGKLEWGAHPALLAREIATRCHDGLLRYSEPERESFRQTGSWADRRKSRPYNLFYGDIEADAQARLAAWRGKAS